MSYTVSAFYHFTPFPDFADWQKPVQDSLAQHGVMGTVLLASEGINGTIAGSQEGIDAAMDYLASLPGCAGLEHKRSPAREMPFYRLKVRLKKEIVTMGVPGVDPNHLVGSYVAPEDWNDLIAQDDVLVIDTRNDYEVEIGTFKGAVDPQTGSFRDFPAWVRDHRKDLEGKRIAMFCTGGIRCEKATSFLKQEGLEDVYHLKGGILKYLETVPEDQSLWKGECFVFDQRVSVGHGLKQGTYDLCHACRFPITDEDKASAHYVPGVSCPKCHGTMSEQQMTRFAERQKQIDLARQRGEVHIGAVPAQANAAEEESLDP